MTGRTWIPQALASSARVLRPPNPDDAEYLTGDGALAVFSRGNMVSYVMMLNVDGRAASDLRQYAGMLDGRVRRDLATRPGAQPSAR